MKNNSIKSKVSRRSFLDDVDKQLLNLLQEDCRRPVLELAKKLGVPKSTVSYRIKRLEEEGIIEGYHAKINPSKLGQVIQLIVQIRAKFGQGYAENIGEALTKIPGIWGVYFVYGESDFIIMARSKNREEQSQVLTFNLPDENPEPVTHLQSPALPRAL